ncbi:MAG TPA: glycosyltransferase family 4 protein [Vicinamibacteria bacterium]
MRILAITAGAANMYCGSCLRDNALARELLRQGHDLTLVPVYTPTRTDEPNVSEARVLYGGVNVYLQQAIPLFRRTPRFIDRLFDSRPVMSILSRLSFSTDPERLGDLTISTLKGEEGFQAKEVAKLIDELRRLPRPDVILLPNSLMIGLAGPLAEAFDRPIVCTLQGEDLFLDGMPGAQRGEAIELIREKVSRVDAFIAVSRYYASYMGQLLSIPPSKLAVVPLGINLEGFAERVEREGGPVVIGYLARVSPEKGLHNLIDAYRRLRQRKSLPPTRLEVAGYLGREHRSYLALLEIELAKDGLSIEYRYHGTLDRKEKIDFLRGIDILSVPTDYEEPKGIFLLEAMAVGVPAVEPRRGAFPELLETTGGGRLVRAGDNRELAEALAALVLDPRARRELGKKGALGVRRHYTVEQMALKTSAVLERVVKGEPLRENEPQQVGVLSN